jgi:hypothetical protein
MLLQNLLRLLSGVNFLASGWFEEISGGVFLCGLFFKG